MVVVRSVRMETCTEDGSVLCSCGKRALMRSTTWMMFAPGCRWMLTMTAGVSFIHAACLMFSAPSTDLGHVREHHRRAILIRHHDRIVVIVAGQQLVVRADQVRLLRPVEIALGLVQAASAWSAVRRSSRLNAIGRQRGGVGLNPHRRLLAAGDADQTDARQL